MLYFTLLYFTLLVWMISFQVFKYPLIISGRKDVQRVQVSRYFNRTDVAEAVLQTALLKSVDYGFPPKIFETPICLNGLQCIPGILVLSSVQGILVLSCNQGILLLSCFQFILGILVLLGDLQKVTIVIFLLLIEKFLNGEKNIYPRVHIGRFDYSPYFYFGPNNLAIQKLAIVLEINGKLLIIQGVKPNLLSNI